MAPQIPFSIIDGILTKLASLTTQEISIYGVPEELSDKLTTVKNVLLDAEEKQEKTGAVKDWVKRLKDVVYDADDLLDDFATHQLQRGGVASQVCDFFSSSNQLVFRFKMSNRLRNIKEGVDKIENLINPLELVQGNTVHSKVVSRRLPTTSLVDDFSVVGRDEDKEEIIKLLVSSGNEKNLSVVAIVGIEGLGKTTLAQLVYNDERVVRHFEFRIWVHVSVGFDVRSLVKEILQEVRKQHVEGLDLFDLKDKLHEELNRRRYLLVLDDVWEVPIDRWEELRSLLIVGNEGSKILVTTGNRKVAEVMGDHSPFDLKRIKEDESLYLFWAIAFEGEERMYQNLINIAEDIVKRCNGVPLLIKSLAAILRFRRQERDWLEILHNENLLEVGHGILRALKLSYSHLPTCLKQCFTYCALFPEDYEIEKKSLMQLWMAQVSDVATPTDDRLEIQKAIARPIIASDVATPTDDWLEIQKEALHVFLFPRVNPLINASEKISSRTFFMDNEDGFEDDSKDDSIINTIISSSKSLRVLSLNKFNIKKVPKFVGKLSHLRYLDLSNNDFEELPSSIARLKHLQTLKVIDCVNLKELPKDTRELVHLRHLENDGCANLTHMPCGIGELTSLQSLPIFVVGNRRGYSRDRKIGGLNELEKLDYLRGELRIKNLENVWNAKESTDAKLAEKKYISSLRLEWRDPEANNERCKAAESVMEELRPHDHLEKLWIDGYQGEKFPEWMHGYNDGLFSKLVHIVLFSCERCQILPPFAQLPVLKFMWLSGLEEVEYVTDCSSATPPFFPSLQMLKLDNLPKLKGLRKKGSSSEEDPSFPLLSKLDVGFCHKLTSLTLHSSPSLSEASLTLHHCLNLKSLTLPSSPCLLELSINTCCKLESLELPSSGLSKLYITECNDLKSLNLHSSPDLSQLTIRDCHNLTSLAQPPSPCLYQLEIRDCAKLTSFELRHSAPKLSSLEIRDCPKLTSLKVPLLPRLEKLHLNTLNKEVLQQFPFVSASRHT
ncbi:putative disease resistance protein RGA4 [Vitis vinifera]|uniref:Putative disease resistance protein RGA4 n=1 Tax=Vitis vinifera TaxID=29760 RepID=A0A438C9N7_VITVI|nr:putative disease resistance protein RGA4 [Vitis vinifera]